MFDLIIDIDILTTPTPPKKTKQNIDKKKYKKKTNQSTNIFSIIIKIK